MAPRNPDEFDGYRKWLGIANKKRPPTHYELLAISLDEDDPEVIRAAAEQRRHYVETKRGDGHDTTVNEILYRIGEAEATLLNDEMRRDYDRQLNLFEKRRKNRQVDPFASPSRVRSQPGRTVGEDSGIVKTFVGIMVVVCVGFGGMAWFSFGLPWSKPEKQPEAVPVVQHALAPDSLPQSVEKPAQVPPAVAQVEPEPVNQTKLEDATGEAKRTLEGEWVCIANEQGGSSISEEAVRQEDRRVTINGSTFKMLRTRGTRGGYEGKFEIEASNGHFEFTGTPVGGGKFIYWFGVYQLDGDILKLSYRQKNNDQATRPTVFKTTGEDQDNPWVSGTYRRASTIAQANANVTYLVTLPRKNIHHHPNGWWSDKGELVLGGENGNPLIRKPLVFDGKESKNSIYMSGLSSAEVFLTYTLNGKFENFEAIAYIPDMLPYQGNPRSPLVFKVVGDGRLLWKSNPLARKREQEPCKTSVAGVKELSLRIECQGADNWALASWIEPRLLGANAQTPATDMPEVATPVAAKDDGPIPEFLNLDEINSEEAEASPWISPDGLTLYWTAKEVGGKDGDDWIWSAIRKTPDARFEAKTKLFRGKFPVVSSDGLEMIFKPNDFDGFSVATRKTASEPFARPRQITELSIAGSYSKPRCLSYNGRSLYFDRDKANGKNNDTWVTTRENRGAKWQAPTPLKFAIPGASQEARFTQVCLTQNELHMFCTAALPKTANEEDVHPAVLSRKTPDGEFTSYQRLTLGNYARDISGWRAFRYCETTKEFVITDKGRKNDLFLVRNVSIPVVEEQAQSDKETGANEAAANWKFWDVFASGVKRNMLIVARDGMLLSPAHDKGFCLTTLKEYSEMDFRMEFQFQTGEGLANPYVGVVSTLPNPAASDWKQQIPRSIQIKLDPKNAGELVLPTADFKVKLNEAQKIHNARHIAPINNAEVKLREWNTLEVKCTGDSKLIVKINGVTVNRLEEMQTNKGHVVIWPSNAEMRLRNAGVVVNGSDTKLSFENLDASPVAAKAPEAAESKLMFSAVRISIAQDGSGKLIVDSREPSDIQAEESKGTSITIPALGDVEAFSEPDGRLRVLYDFSKFKALDQLNGPWLSQDEMILFKQISIDADEKALVFNPGSLGKVRLRFPRPVQGPLDMNVFLKGVSEGVVQLQFGNGQDVLIVSLHGKNSPEKEATGTVLAAMKTGNTFAPLLRANQPMVERKEFDFKVKPAWSQERTAILLAYQGDVPIAIPRLEVQARMIPSFGIGLAQKGKRVIAEKILDGSAGAAAGIKAGDTILKINGKASDDVAGAMKLLGESTLDKDAVFEIERFGKKQTINVTPK